MEADFLAVHSVRDLVHRNGGVTEQTTGYMASARELETAIALCLQAPWTPDQVKGIESESLLFHFMGPSSRFTRPGWETLSWPKSAGVSARWAEEKTFSW